MSDHAGTSDLTEAARRSIRAGQADHAAKLAEEALRTNADDLAALEVLVAVARARGDHSAAETALRRILAVAPDARVAGNMLIEILIETGRDSEAEILRRQAVALYSEDASAHAGMASELSTPVELAEGEWHLRRAIELDGRTASLLVALARNLAGQGLLGQAEALATEALRVDERLLQARILLVEIHEQSGDLGAASAVLDEIEQQDAWPRAELRSARIALAARGDRWTDALAELDADGALGGSARLLRGRLRERAGRYDEAWPDFVAAKAALASDSGRAYDRAGVESHFSAVARAFSAPFWKTVPRAALRTDVPQPIFILGFPRSGTTMTEQALASHSQIRAGGELPFGSQLRDFAQQLLGRGLTFPAGMGELAAADYHHVPALFRDFYLARAATRKLTSPGVAYFTDKMPLNETYLPLLRLAFPHAPMILVRRHPLDTLVSVMSHDMTHGFNCGYRLADAAHQLAAVSQLTVHYRDALELETYDLGYERFVVDQNGETARLMAHIGLDPEPAQLRFHESARHAPTPSYAQVKEPVHARSVERWRNYRDELAPALRLVAAAVADGGYAI